MKMGLTSLSAGEARSIVQNTARKIRNIWARHKIAGVIQGLRASVVEESDRRLRYKVDDSAVAADMSATTKIDPRLPALYVGADRLVSLGLMDQERRSLSG